MESPDATLRRSGSDEGAIVERATPQDFFDRPRSERAKDFLSKILSH